jgi:hypothetical protein
MTIPEHDKQDSQAHWESVEKWLVIQHGLNKFSYKHFIKFMLIVIASLAVAALILDAFLNTIGFNLGYGDYIVNLIT